MKKTSILFAVLFLLALSVPASAGTGPGPPGNIITEYLQLTGPDDPGWDFPEHYVYWKWIRSINGGAFSTDIPWTAENNDLATEANGAIGYWWAQSNFLKNYNTFEYSPPGTGNKELNVSHSSSTCPPNAAACAYVTVWDILSTKKVHTPKIRWITVSDDFYDLSNTARDYYMAHELGHIFGLGDLYEDGVGDCPTMGEPDAIMCHPLDGIRDYDRGIYSIIFDTGFAQQYAPDYQYYIYPNNVNITQLGNDRVRSAWRDYVWSEKAMYAEWQRWNGSAWTYLATTYPNDADGSVWTIEPRYLYPEMYPGSYGASSGDYIRSCVYPNFGYRGAGSVKCGDFLQWNP